jgi:hypothetical protein
MIASVNVRHGEPVIEECHVKTWLAPTSAQYADSKLAARSRSLKKGAATSLRNLSSSAPA